MKLLVILIGILCRLVCGRRFSTDGIMQGDVEDACFQRFYYFIVRILQSDKLKTPPVYISTYFGVNADACHNHDITGFLSNDSVIISQFVAHAIKYFNAKIADLHLNFKIGKIHEFVLLILQAPSSTTIVATRTPQH